MPLQTEHRRLTLAAISGAAGAGITVAFWLWWKRKGRDEHFGQAQHRDVWHVDAVDDAVLQESEFSVKKTKSRRRHDSDVAEETHRAWQQKEDSLIQLIFDLMNQRGMSLRRACEHAESLIYEYIHTNARNELEQLAPTLIAPTESSLSTRHLHSAMPLSKAFRKYDMVTHIASRMMVPPQFREVRNIVNLAQVLATASLGPQLITFDGDGTLYPDRCTLEDDEENGTGLATRLAELMRLGVTVALCTAVGDPSPEPYEHRLRGLIGRLKDGPALKGSLFAVGGQCNYVFRYCWEARGLVALPREEWEPAVMHAWTPERIAVVLDAAEAALKVGASRLGMEGVTRIIRKQKAVGILYEGKVHKSTAYFLDELALLARDAVKRAQHRGDQDLPFCTFNGGRDVFVDVGTKKVGIDTLRALVGASRSQTLHVGDQFTRTGNDLLARRACGTLWVDDPQETAVLMSSLLEAMA